MIIKTLTHWLENLPHRNLCLGLSGGQDSTVLLHALSQCHGCNLRAIHCNHQIHPDSHHWAEHCLHQARRLGIPCQSFALTVSGPNLELGARQARMACFERELDSNEILILAHHAQDQLETLLYRICRGTGVHGLAAMRPWQHLGKLTIARPLLTIGKEVIHSYAIDHGLTWLDDPSNQSCHHDRNYLRHHTIPTLLARWPQASVHAATLCDQLNHALEILDAEQQQRLATLSQPACHPWPSPTLDVAAVATHPPADQSAILYQWLRSHGAANPNRRTIERIQAELLPYAGEGTPSAHGMDFQVRRYRQRLYLCPNELLKPPATASIPWDGQHPLPWALGVLTANHPEAVSVQTPILGQKLWWQGRTRRAKEVFQGIGIPPWVRPWVPIIQDSHGVCHLPWQSNWRWQNQHAILSASISGDHA